MDRKLEDFVALLQRAAPRPATPLQRPRPPVPAAQRLLGPKRFPLFWSRPAPPTPSARLWINLGCGAAALAAISVAIWLALPGSPAPPQVAAPPAPASRTAAVGKLTLPFPQSADAEPEEQGEMTEPDPATDAPEAPSVPAAGERKLAALAPQRATPLRPGEPQWLRFAVAAPKAEGHLRIAIVIDDLGLDKKRTERTIALPAPLTLSFLAYATDLPRLTDAAHRAGHELLVHVPMEPISRAEDMGPNGLAVSLGADEVLRRLRWDLARFDGYVGINNHMGSRFTSDAQSMLPVLEELKARGLLFLDSRTIGSSTGVELARRLGVPHAARDVFLDNELNANAVAQRLAEVEQVARHHGSAIAIGHPHDATLDQLQSWLAGLEAKGFMLVPVTAIVREHTRVAGGSG